MTKYRVRRDGPGWGVQEYMPRYRDWVPINDEPFLGRKAAQEYLDEVLAEDGAFVHHNFSRERYAFQHGTEE